MELLGVIIILSLLAMVAILGVTRVVQNSKEELYETQIKSIKLAAETWGSENINELPANGECMYITLSTLKNFSLLDDTVIDSRTNDKLSDDLKIKISATSDKFNNINYIYEVDVDDTEIEDCDAFKINMLVTGQEFNAKVKTLANGSEKTYSDSDTVVTSIEFYSYGKLPINYTKETLTALSSVDVSVDGDNSIMAYYNDNGSIYVYSEKKIYGNSDCDSMFQIFTNLTNLDLTHLDTSTTTIMSGMFYHLSGLTILDIDNLNTKNAMDMSYMFYGCINLKILDVSNFNTQNVTTMKAMFASSSSIGSMALESIIGLEKFNTKNVKNMQAMFQKCVNLTELNINNWNTSNVENMLGLFLECNNLLTLNLSNWNTRAVNNMNTMFQNTTNLTCIQVGDNWQVATTATDMFSGSGVSTTTTDECVVTTS